MSYQIQGLGQTLGAIGPECYICGKRGQMPFTEAGIPAHATCYRQFVPTPEEPLAAPTEEETPLADDLADAEHYVDYNQMFISPSYEDQDWEFNP